MTRVAAIDCGTNSIRLLIADQGPDGLSEVDRRLELVRLGQDVDRTGVFHPDALRRTFTAIDDYAERIKAAGVERVRFVATSASRDVQNRDVFVAGVRDRLGVEPEVIAGAEEARLSYRGALQVLAGSSQSDPSSGPVPSEPAQPDPAKSGLGQSGSVQPDRGTILVTDIGGGSTELILGTGDGQITAATSLNIGSVRLRERFLRSDPITPAEQDAAATHIDQELAASGLDLSGVTTWIGVAGTITSMAAVGLELSEYDRARVHGAQLSPEQITSITDRFVSSTVAELTQIPTLAPMRAEVIAGGALICQRIAAQVRTPLQVSETDILDAVALEA